MVKSILSRKVINHKFYTLLAFLIISIGFFFLLGYNKVATKGPYSKHSYRQSDSYAFSLNYYYENNNFFEPTILFTGENGHGKTVSEFPILYYITAKIWKITGINPLVPKLIDLLILFLGLFYLYKLSYEFLDDHFWAFVVSMMLFSSPLIGFYGFNFIPNIPALGLALIGTYYFYKFSKTLNYKWLIISSVIFCLAALLKVSSLFLFLATNAVFLIYCLLNFKTRSKVFLTQLSSIFFVLLMVLSWFLFTKNYNLNNLGGIFNQTIIPIWSLSPERIRTICDTAFTNTIIYFFNPQALIVLGIMLLFSLALWRKTSPQILAVTSFLFVGIVLFILLFFDGMDAHEYFLIDATIIIPAITLTFLSSIKKMSLQFFQSIGFKLFALVLLLFLIDYNIAVTRAHFNPHDRMVEKNIPLPKRVKDYWDWVYWDWETGRKKYEGIVPYLRSLGIRFEDKVISVPDGTPNLTLTLLQQRGFTDYHYTNNYQGINRTKKKIELGAKYMIVLGEDNLLREDVAPYTQNLIGEYNGIKIFRLESN